MTTSFKTQEDVETEYAEYREFSSSLASGLVSGAEVVGECNPQGQCSFNWLLMTGRGMVKGAVKTSEFLFHGSEYAKQHIAPEGVRAVDPKVEKFADKFHVHQCQAQKTLRIDPQQTVT